jgi:hypothetical protein
MKTKALIIVTINLVGRYLFQAKFIKRSYRYRGKVARRINQNEDTIKLNSLEKSLNNSSPQKIETLKHENIIIIAYSLKKISTNPVAEYSTLNPDTNSDSPSEKSNGVRLVSAKRIISHRVARQGQ